MIALRVDDSDEQRPGYISDYAGELTAGVAEQQNTQLVGDAMASQMPIGGRLVVPRLSIGVRQQHHLTIIDTLGTPRPPVERLDHEATVEAARAALGAASFAAAWAEGQALTPEEAVAYALADEPEPAPAADEQAKPGRLGAY